jgi:hypothetical protein
MASMELLLLSSHKNHIIRSTALLLISIYLLYLVHFPNSRLTLITKRNILVRLSRHSNTRGRQAAYHQAPSQIPCPGILFYPVVSFYPNCRCSVSLKSVFCKVISTCSSELHMVCLCTHDRPYPPGRVRY